LSFTVSARATAKTKRREESVDAFGWRDEEKEREKGVEVTMSRWTANEKMVRG